MSLKDKLVLRILQSPYLDDVTKNEVLKLVELDQNLLNLKGRDISDLFYDHATNELVLVKENGDEIRHPFNQGGTGNGFQGATGPQGPTGPAGGPVGATGPKGEKGDTGPSELDADVPTTVVVGASEAYTIIPSGITFSDYVRLIHQKVFNPTFVNPTYSLSRGNTGLYVIDSTVSIPLTFTYNRGQIRGDVVSGEWEPNTVQDFRGGEAVTYTIEGFLSLSNTVNQNHTVVQGINSFQGFVTYQVGPQPLDSLGQPFDTPFPAGDSPVRTTSIEGVYPIFATVDDIVNETQLPLYSMLNSNNIEIDLIAEANGNKQFFEFPDVWLDDRPITKIEFFNTASNQYDNSNQLSTFDTSIVFNVVEGNNIPYTRFTSNAPDRGELRIRIRF